MKFVLFSVVVLGSHALLCAQVVSERRGVTSPFFTYDDASLTEPGILSIGQYASFDYSSGGNSFSVPGIDFSLGLNRRLELSGFGAALFLQDDGRHYASKLDDSSVGLKVLLWNESERRPAVAVKAMIERFATPNWAGRTHLILPVMVEKSFRFCDLAFTAGYVIPAIAFSSLECSPVGQGGPIQLHI